MRRLPACPLPCVFDAQQVEQLFARMHVEFLVDVLHMGLHGAVLPPAFRAVCVLDLGNS